MNSSIDLKLQLFSGTWPFVKITRDRAVIRLVVRGERPERPDSPTLEDSMWALIERCWAQKPADRLLVADAVAEISRICSSRTDPRQQIYSDNAIAFSPVNSVGSHTVTGLSQSSDGTSTASRRSSYDFVNEDSAIKVELCEDDINSVSLPDHTYLSPDPKFLRLPSPSGGHSSLLADDSPTTASYANHFPPQQPVTVMRASTSYQAVPTKELGSESRTTERVEIKTHTHGNVPIALSVSPRARWDDVSEEGSCEPSEDWKQDTWRRVNENIRPDRLALADERALRLGGPGITDAARRYIEHDYAAEVVRLRNLANERFLHTLREERMVLKLSAGVALSQSELQQQELLLAEATRPQGRFNSAHQSIYLPRSRQTSTSHSPTAASLSVSVETNTNYVSTPDIDLVDNIEPDEGWKQDLRRQIQHNLLPDFQFANRDRDAKLGAPSCTPHMREIIEEEYNTEIKRLRQVADDRYDHAMNEERIVRKTSMGSPLSDGEMKIQEEIFQDIAHRSRRQSSASSLSAANISVSAGSPGRESNSNANPLGSTLNRGSNSFEKPRSFQISTSPTLSRTTFKSLAPDPNVDRVLDWARRPLQRSTAKQHDFASYLANVKKIRARYSTSAVAKIMQDDEQSWRRLDSKTNLKWEDFPWPTLGTTSTYRNLTTCQVGAYVLSMYNPSQKSDMERIRIHAQRWNPSRLESRYGAKFISDKMKEMVMEGADAVAVALNDLRTW